MSDEIDKTLRAIGVERGNAVVAEAPAPELTDDERKERLAAQQRDMQRQAESFWLGRAVSKELVSFLGGGNTERYYDKENEAQVKRRVIALDTPAYRPTILAVEVAEADLEEARLLFANNLKIIREHQEVGPGFGVNLRHYFHVAVPHWLNFGRTAKLHIRRIENSEYTETWLEAIDRHLQPPALVVSRAEPR